jgi:hypothetical protein
MESTRRAFWVVGASFRDLWQDIFMSLACSLLWLIANALIIPGPPATMTLFYYGNRQAHGEMTNFFDLWRDFRRTWRVGWRWGILNLLVFAMLLGDIHFTGGLSWSSTVILYAQGFYLAVIGFWLLVQVYALAFLREQAKPSISMALRNSAVLLGRNIGFSVVLGALLGLILLVGLPLFMLSGFFGGVFLAGVGNHAVLLQIENAATKGSEKK